MDPVSGRRRAPRPAGRHRRIWAAAGAFAVVLAVCAAVTYTFGMRGAHHAVSSKDGGGVQNSPMSAPGGNERDAVPDACTALTPGIADSLAPGAQRTEMGQDDQSDQHSECAWSLYGSTRTRQLTVELRALTAQGRAGATSVAVQTFDNEWQSDREGKDLADTAAVRDSRGVSGVGEQAYVVYTVDTKDRIGEAVANARLANVLVTVHYSGGDQRDADGRPLSSSEAVNGALSVARDVISKLESQS